VVLGADVAAQLKYTLGEKIIVGHGLNAVAGLGDHESHPFTVVGILARTYTPLDRALFVTLDGIQHMHGAEDDGATISARQGPPPMPGAEPPPVMPGAEPPVMPGAQPPAGVVPAPIVDDPTAISAFLLGTKSRFETLRLQREVNDSKREPLTAVIPGVALAELWKTLGTIEGGLRIVGALTIVVGLLGMLVALYSSLEARRREMAVLRAVGAGPGTIVGLLVLESGLLTLLGCALGVALVLGGFAAAQSVIEARTGVHIEVHWPGALEWAYIGVVLAAGVLVGLIPAWRAYRSSLADGLSPRL
jgi:putative ABC transport system permease protein